MGLMNRKCIKQRPCMMHVEVGGRGTAARLKNEFRKHTLKIKSARVITRLVALRIYLEIRTHMCQSPLAVRQNSLNISNEQTCMKTESVYVNKMENLDSWNVKDKKNWNVLCFHIVAVGWKPPMCKTVTFQDSNSRIKIADLSAILCTCV